MIHRQQKIENIKVSFAFYIRHLHVQVRSSMHDYVYLNHSAVYKKRVK